MDSGIKGRREEAENVLGGLRQGMEVDGYLLHVLEVINDTLLIRIEATINACKECLVPKEVMGEIVKTHLPASLGVKRVSLIYPNDEGAEVSHTS